MQKCRCSRATAHEHFIMTCRVCGSSYDNDFDPPLLCHDGEDDWEVELVESVGTGRSRLNKLDLPDFTARDS